MFKIEVFDHTGTVKEQTLFNGDFTVESWTKRFMKEGSLTFSMPRYRKSVGIRKQITVYYKEEALFAGFISAKKTFDDTVQYVALDMIGLIAGRVQPHSLFALETRRLFEATAASDLWAIKDEFTNFTYPGDELFSLNQAITLYYASGTPYANFAAGTYYIHSFVGDFFKLKSTLGGSAIARSDAPLNILYYKVGSLDAEIKQSLNELNERSDTGIRAGVIDNPDFESFTLFNSNYLDTLLRISDGTGLEFEIDENRRLNVKQSIGSLYPTVLELGRNIVKYDIEEDSSRMVNSVILKDKIGFNAYAEDPESIAAYGRREEVKTLQFSSWQEYLDNYAANYKLNRSKPLTSIELTTTEHGFNVGDTVRIRVPELDEVRRILEIESVVSENGEIETTLVTTKTGITPSLARIEDQNSIVNRIKDLEEL